MTIDDKIRDEKLSHNISRHYQYYHQAKLLSMNILLKKKYYLLIKAEWWSK